MIEFIRDPAMLIHLRAKSELDLTTVTQATLESIPIRTNSNDDPFYIASTEPLNANGKLLVELPRNEGFNIGEVLKKAKVSSIKLNLEPIFLSTDQD